MTNARSDSIKRTGYASAYATSRCLVPASCWYEWTGDKSRKTMWKFTVNDQTTFAFPGIFSTAICADDGAIDSFALLTSEPSADLRLYHNRQPVILGRADWANWLDASNDLAPCFKGSPHGSVAVEYFSGPQAPKPMARA